MGQEDEENDLGRLDIVVQERGHQCNKVEGLNVRGPLNLTKNFLDLGTPIMED